MLQKANRILSFFICFCFIFEQFLPIGGQAAFAQMAAELNLSGYLSTLKNSIAPDKYRPLHLRYLDYDLKQNNFKLLLDKGDAFSSSAITQERNNAITAQTQELMKYFFVGISLPNDSFWVNLRPDSSDNVIDGYLGQTDVGKILLEADLQLKKDTASFTSPQTPEGKKYWDSLYKKAEELLGQENLTIPTLVRPWVVPGEIIIRETKDNAYIYKATLKVMLEEDYLEKTGTVPFLGTVPVFSDPRLKALNTYSAQLIRELIIPKLTKEVNSSKRYAPLRQVYYSLIFAQWFKARFKGLSPSVSTDRLKGTVPNLIDSRNLTNIISKDPWSKATYFKEYQRSFKDGEYNIQEPVSTPTGQSIRSYFSGGVQLTLQPQDFPKFGEPRLGSSPVVTLPALNSSRVSDSKNNISRRSMIAALSKGLTVTLIGGSAFGDSALSKPSLSPNSDTVKLPAIQEVRFNYDLAELLKAALLCGDYDKALETLNKLFGLQLPAGSIQRSTNSRGPIRSGDLGAVLVAFNEFIAYCKIKGITDNNPDYKKALDAKERLVGYLNTKRNSDGLYRMGGESWPQAVSAEHNARVVLGIGDRGAFGELLNKVYNPKKPGGFQVGVSDNDYAGDVLPLLVQAWIGLSEPEIVLNNGTKITREFWIQKMKELSNPGLMGYAGRTHTEYACDYAIAAIRLGDPGLIEQGLRLIKTTPETEYPQSPITNIKLYQAEAELKRRSGTSSPVGAAENNPHLEGGSVKKAQVGFIETEDGILRELADPNIDPGKRAQLLAKLDEIFKEKRMAYLEAVKNQYKEFPGDSNISAVTKRTNKNQLAAVVVGNKPAFISDVPVDTDNADPDMTWLIGEARHRGLSVKICNGSYVIGKEENVNAIIKLWTDVIEGRRPVDSAYHRELGGLLGYSDQAINEYVVEMEARERLVQIGRMMRKLGFIRLGGFYVQNDPTKPLVQGEAFDAWQFNDKLIALRIKDFQLFIGTMGLREAWDEQKAKKVSFDDLKNMVSSINAERVQVILDNLTDFLRKNPAISIVSSSLYRLAERIYLAQMRTEGEVIPELTPKDFEGIAIDGIDLNDIRIRRVLAGMGMGGISNKSSSSPVFVLQDAYDVIGSGKTMAELMREIVSVYNSALNKSEAEEVDYMQMEKWRQLIEAHKVEVALINGKIVAYIIHDILGNGAGYLQMLMVAKEAQNEGIGYSLMDRAINKLREKGIGLVKIEPEYDSGGFHNKYFHSRYPDSRSTDFTKVSFAYVNILSNTANTGQTENAASRSASPDDKSTVVSSPVEDKGEEEGKSINFRYKADSVRINTYDIVDDQTGKVVGNTEFSLDYDKERLVLADINIDYRRQGFGVAVVKALAQEAVRAFPKSKQPFWIINIHNPYTWAIAKNVLSIESIEVSSFRRDIGATLEEWIYYGDSRFAKIVDGPTQEIPGLSGQRGYRYPFILRGRPKQVTAASPVAPETGTFSPVEVRQGQGQVNSNPGGIDGSANSPSITASKKTGGIDFRNLPIVTQALANLQVNTSSFSINRLKSIDLIQEWSKIENLVNSGIRPSAERIKEYIQASCLQDNSSQQDMDKVILCICDVLRAEEEQCCVTDPSLRDILVVLESGISDKELKSIFMAGKS